MAKSLWGQEFSIQKTPTKKLINKVNNPVQINAVKVIKSKSQSVSVQQKMELIKSQVNRILGVYKQNTICLRTRQQLKQYVDKAIQNGIIAVDTETNNSLQPVDCKLAGACIYTPGQKNAYVPVNHINRFTGEKLQNQVTEQDIKEQFDRLNNTKIITHNGKFDYEVLKCTTGVKLDIYWDTFIGARCLNQNEKAGLKNQYISKIDNSIQKYDIEHLFEGLSYLIFEPQLFALYAATDSFMTYKLYEYQLKEFQKKQNESLYGLFKDIQMKVLVPTAQMELNGVCIDFEYAERLNKKYHKKLANVELKIKEELDKYKQTIERWRLTQDANFKKKTVRKNGQGFLKSKNQKLENPVNTSSPEQLSILLYDVLKVPSVDKKSPRGTGQQILQKINLPICKLILEQRGILKLLSTYIQKLPNCVCKTDNKVHASFNQYGADTGRFSSSDPNLQNIPSHDKSIRLMFCASPGCVMVGSDFSAQQPRLLATYSQDKSMIQAYEQGKDLYAVVGTKVYNNNYQDNRQFYPDGTPNPQGKKRRSQCKTILLGLMYGRGAAAIAQQTGRTKEQSQQIIDTFYTQFPKVKKWVSETQSNAKKTGYVEDLWGRRRRLPDIQLPRYQIKCNSNNHFNPLLYVTVDSSNQKIINKYTQLLKKSKSLSDYQKIKQQAQSQGVTINNNGGFISRAERQCVNARIQGGAASMSKRAMITLYNDEEINKLGFKLLIMVHDELIGECPEQNVDKVKQRLSYLMQNAGKPQVTIPMKCDAVQFSHWYMDQYSTQVKKFYSKLIKEKSYDQAIDILCEQFQESTKQNLLKILE